MQRAAIAPLDVVGRVDDTVAVVVPRNAPGTCDVFNRAGQIQSRTVGNSESERQVLRTTYIERVADRERAIGRNRIGSIVQI